MNVKLSMREIGHIRAALDVVIHQHRREMSPEEAKELQDLLDVFWQLECGPDTIP